MMNTATTSTATKSTAPITRPATNPVGFFCASLALAIGSLGATGCLYENRLVERYETELRVKATTQLLLDHDAGELTVIGDAARTSVLLEVELRSRYSHNDDESDDDARRAIELASGRVDDQTGRIIAELDSAPDGYSLDVTAYIPDHFTMKITDTSGDVFIEGIAGLRLDDNSGDTVIRNIAGNVEVRDEAGDLEVLDVAGNVSVTDSSGDLIVRNAAGRVTVDDGSGDIEAVGIGDNLILTDGSGDLTARDVEGDVAVDDDSGDISIRAVSGTVVVRDGSGDISVHGAADVTIEEDGAGDIDIR